MEKTIRKIRKQPGQKPRKPIIVVDIETQPIGNGYGDERDFIIGAYMRENDDTVYHFRTLEEWMFLILKYRGYIWYAHNGGEFDYKFLVPLIVEYQKRSGFHCDIVRQGERVVGFIFTYQKRRFELRDSYALIPSSLKRISHSFAPQYEKLTLDLGTTVFNPNNAEHMRYLEYDVRGLMVSLQKFFTLIDDIWHVKCGFTAPSTALRCWRTTLQNDMWRQRFDVEKFVRTGYYGGLVFVRSVREHTDCVTIDVNSMYPYVMRKYGVPVGNATYTTMYRANRPGFYRIKVSGTDVPFTFLPYRDKFLLWPHGTFDTVISSVELEYAQERGYVLDVIEGYVFDTIEYIFSDFVDTCENLRIAHKGTAIEETVKIMQNSVYGKFGSNPLVDRYVISHEQPQGFDNVCDSSGLPSEYLFTIQDELKATYLQPHWSAWITAQARMYLTRLVYDIGPDFVLYGDTDSITMYRSAYDNALARGVFTIGVQYGQVKIDKEWASFIAGGPKNYAGILKNGDVVGRSKGIPSRSLEMVQHLESLRTGTPFVAHFESTNSTISILKYHKPFSEKRKRTVSRIQNSAGWLVDELGKVYPVTVGF